MNTITSPRLGEHGLHAQVDAALHEIGADDASGDARSANTSAGKTLALLDAFSGPLSVIGVTALAQRAGVSKSTAHRLLAVLVTHGYVRRVGDRYCLTEHLFEVGNRAHACRPSGIRELAMPYLGDLYAQSRLTVHLAVLAGTDVLYLDKVSGHGAPKCPTAVGARRPAYSTALGKALLAFADAGTVEASLRVRFRRFTPYTIATATQLERALERVGQDGVATDHEESRQGVHCIAAPVFDAESERAIAAVSICSSSGASEKRFRGVLLRATAELSRRRLINA